MAERTDAPITPWDIYGERGEVSPRHKPRGLTPEERAVERAEQCGLSIDRVEHVAATSDIDLRDGTLNFADGPIHVDANVDNGHVENTALVGTDGARLVIPRGDWGYDIRVRGGRDLLISGIDFDQTAGHGARGRIWLAGDNCIVERLQTIGLTPEPGYTGNEPHDMTGPTFYMPATSEGAQNQLRDAHVINGGTMQSRHYGIGPIGVWMGPAHRGTLDIDDFTLIDCPSDGVYVTNTTGVVNVRNSTFRNCCTAAIRIANGVIENCDVSFDYQNTRLSNADNPGNSNTGISVESKQGVSGVEIRNTTSHMINVAQSRGALSVRNMTTPGVVELADNCEFLVDNAHFTDEEEAPGARIDAGSALHRVEGSVFGGEARTGIHLWNSSETPVESAENQFADTRPRFRGDVQ